MPAIGNIVLADGQGTPVNHTFAPVQITSEGIAQWADRSGGIGLGFPTLSCQLRQPIGSNGASRLYRDTWQIRYPILEVTSPSTGSGIQPAPTLSYTHGANIELLLPERGTLANRKDLGAFMANLAVHATFKAIYENLEAIY